MRNSSFNKEIERKERVVTFLNRQEVDFLDSLGKDALFSTGAKLSRAKIISWLVDFVEHLKLKGEGLKSEGDFETRIIELLKKNTPPATGKFASGA